MSETKADVERKLEALAKSLGQRRPTATPESDAFDGLLARWSFAPLSELIGREGVTADDLWSARVEVQSRSRRAEKQAASGSMHPNAGVQGGLERETRATLLGEAAAALADQRSAPRAAPVAIAAKPRPVAQPTPRQAVALPEKKRRAAEHRDFEDLCARVRADRLAHPPEPKPEPEESSAALAARIVATARRAGAIK